MPEDPVSDVFVQGNPPFISSRKGTLKVSVIPLIRIHTDVLLLHRQLIWFLQQREKIKTRNFND